MVAEGMNETSFLPLDEGGVLAACRSDEPEEATYVVSSSDGGANWGTPARVTDRLQHPADLTALSDGRILIVYGHRRFPFGVRGRISKDGGLTWSRDEVVFAEDAESQDCGYPSAISLPKGLVLVLYYQLGSHSVANLEGRCTAVRVRERALVGIR
jgi:Neuraminidase (sialidase)